MRMLIFFNYYIHNMHKIKNILVNILLCILNLIDFLHHFITLIIFFTINYV